jgi:cytochrome d ubiquinol oxidase subunit I
MAFTLGFHILLVPFGVCLPLFTLIANWYGLRHNDPAAMQLARRWSHVMGVTFAVGAVTGTVLSFEMGLLWPGLLGRFGDVFGLPFMIEGVAFFLEAIFIAIYIFGWDRLNPRVHLWLGLPLPLFAALGAFSIISANSWMNTPRGFSLDAAGKVTAVDPWAAILNPALPHELKAP